MGRQGDRGVGGWSGCYGSEEGIRLMLDVGCTMPDTSCACRYVRTFIDGEVSTARANEYISKIN